jgi:heme A synthase
LIALLAWRAWRGLRQLGWPLRGAMLAGGLVLVQAGVGGLTVEKNLAEELVAAHLGLAMHLLGTLLWLAVRARVVDEGDVSASSRRATMSASPRPPPGAALKVVSGAAAVLLLAAIVAGGYVAGTEKEGTESAPVGGAHLACGEQFPGCANQGVLPLGESRLIDIQLTHRVLVYGASLSILGLLGIAWARGSRSRLLPLAGGLLALQLALGVLNVVTGKHATLVLAHLTAATLLWAAVLLIAYRLAWAPAPAPTTRRSSRPEASAAAA